MARCLGVLVLAAVGVVALLLLQQSQNTTESQKPTPDVEPEPVPVKPNDGIKPVDDWRSQLAKMSTPYRVKVGQRGFEVDAASINDDEWQVAVAEGSDAPAIMISKSAGNPLLYSLDYDSSKSRYKPATGGAIKQIKFLAAKDDGSYDSDWALHVEGKSGRHLSVAAGDGFVVYDGSFGVEVPVKQAPGLSAQYALDAKRRSGSGRLLPSWVRHSAGLRYATKLGDFKLSMHQRDPDAILKTGVDTVAAYKGAAKGIPGSPEYSLRATQVGQAPTKCEGKLCVKGPLGTSGGVDVVLEQDATTISAHGKFSGKRRVVKGIDVAADSKIVFTPSAADEQVALEPVVLKASADLAELLPDFAGSGSKMSVQAKYSVGSQQPALSGSVQINPTAVSALKMTAEGMVDSEGSPSGSIRVDGDIASGITSVPSLQKATQVFIPSTLQDGKLVAMGRFAHSTGGSPRLQLGLEYSYDMADSSVKLQAGDLPRGSDTPWVNPRPALARQTADAMRKRIDSTDGLGQQWLQE